MHVRYLLAMAWKRRVVVLIEKMGLQRRQVMQDRTIMWIFLFKVQSLHGSW
jgi:hypothetical protein